MPSHSLAKFQRDLIFQTRVMWRFFHPRSFTLWSKCGVKQIVRFVTSPHVCESLTSVSSSNKPNWAVFLFVQTPFDAGKQSVLGVHYQVLLACDTTRFVECIHIAVFVIFTTSFLNRNSHLLALADANPCKKAYNIALQINFMPNLYWIFLEWTFLSKTLHVQAHVL